MNACETSVVYRGKVILSSDTMQVIRGIELVRKVLSSQSSDGQAVTAAGLQKVKAAFTPHEIVKRRLTGIRFEKYFVR